MDKNGQTVSMDLHFADTFFQKLVGLLGSSVFPDYEGLFFSGVRCIHTFFMNYAIDVLFLDRSNTVCKVKKNVKPFRIVWGTEDCISVVEMRSGASAEAAIMLGDIISKKDKNNE